MRKGKEDRMKIEFIDGKTVHFHASGYALIVELDQVCIRLKQPIKTEYVELKSIILDLPDIKRMYYGSVKIYENNRFLSN